MTHQRHLLLAICANDHDTHVCHVDSVRGNVTGNIPARHVLDMDMSAITVVLVPRTTPQMLTDPHHRKLLLFPPRGDYQLLD